MSKSQQRRIAAQRGEDLDVVYQLQAKVAKLERENERLRKLVPMSYRAGFSDAGCEVPTTYGEAWGVIEKELEQTE